MRRVEATMLAVLALLLAVLGSSANAEAPRWVTGPPYFTSASGTPVIWYTTTPLYFTDPGDLSATVNHAAADAMVAAAAGIWNVPTSAMEIAYGGALAEHVSAANSYGSSGGLVFPTDVRSANYAAIQIAVIYDSDGSVTDLLLGGGASNPAECRQNGVTESVDSITPAGLIQHAILVLNGLCTGSAPAQQLQMQYQLERAFGRVLGVGWSQTNDNVFTGKPQPTTLQAQHWPIMHPIDIVCGLYTYQCLPQPFALRDDDVAAISSLYGMVVLYGEPSTPPMPGKVWSYDQASQVSGAVSFPTGEGMQGVNVVVERMQGGMSAPQPWYDVSSVSGFLFQQNSGNPVTGATSGMAASMGSPEGPVEGLYTLGWVPDIDPAGSLNGPMHVVVTTEAINPLYVGAYSVGPYVSGNVEPSGAPMTITGYGPAVPYFYPADSILISFAPGDAASNCSTADDGVETEPLPVAVGGWWTGVLCAHGHTAWSSFAAQAGRTATLEVTALDEGGLATTAKAMPLIGAWAASDPTGTLPTLAATPSAFNTVSLGMTATGVEMAQAEGVRLVIADARGDGRPDFAYRARVLYADSIQPVAVSASGGQVTISGMGFRAGNTVTVNGVAAAVSSWTASAIVAVAPPESAFAVRPTGPVGVTVVDLSTRGSTVMMGALSYSAVVAPDIMTLVLAPPGTVAVGAASQFAVRVTLGDGVTPVAGMPVTFSVGSGAVQIAGCAATPCGLMTDASGMASAMVTATAFGSVSVQAAAVGAVEMAAFAAVARNVTATQSVEYVAAGAVVAWTPRVSVVENGAAAMGTAVLWTSSAGMAVSPASSVASTLGLAQTAAVAGPLAAGVQATGQACAWTTVCASFAAVGVDPSAWRLVVESGAGQTVADSAVFAPVLVMVTDVSGDPVAGAAVSVYQTVAAAQMACPVRGPCPIAPVLAASNMTAVSDANGLVSAMPMQLAGVGEVTSVAVATGMQGFVSLTLTQQP